MQLLTFCLLVIVGHNVTGVSLGQIQQKLHEIQKDLTKLNRSVLHNDLMLNTPQTEDIKKCCSGQALQCFSEKLHELRIKPKLPRTASLKKRLSNSLQKTAIQNSVNSCSENETKNASCQECDSYPMRDSKQFVLALKTLLQQSYDTRAGPV